jgi:hypothetical protein
MALFHVRGREIAAEGNESFAEALEVVPLSGEPCPGGAVDGRSRHGHRRADRRAGVGGGVGLGAELDAVDAQEAFQQPGAASIAILSLRSISPAAPGRVALVAGGVIGVRAGRGVAGGRTCTAAHEGEQSRALGHEGGRVASAGAGLNQG